MTRKPKADSASASAPRSLQPRYEISAKTSGRVAEPAPAYATPTPTTVVSATEAARRFSDLINRACYQRETFIIERGGRRICQLGPIQASHCTGADLLASLSTLPKPDEEFLDAVEALARMQIPVAASPWDK